MRLTRAHGLGNVYLVLDDGPELAPGLVRAVCDRERGVGSDGILEPRATARADHGFRIWNPDGSVAEKSGNGLRIAARWLADRGAGADFTVDTGFDVVRCQVHADGVRVEMGRATVDPARVPLVAPGPVVEGRLGAPAPDRPITVLSVGNPHAVVFVDQDVDAAPWREWGAALETHPAFPNRTNVQIARVRRDGVVEVRIWERGAGPTPASGSSACAVAAAAVLTGRRAPGVAEVVAPGGSLRIEVSPDLDLVLDGPVEVVGRVELDARWLADRGVRGGTARTP